MPTRRKAELFNCCLIFLTSRSALKSEMCLSECECGCGSNPARVVTPLPPPPFPRLPPPSLACIPISNRKYRFLPPNPILTLHQNMISLVNTQVRQFQLQRCAIETRQRYFGRSVRLPNCGHIDQGNIRVKYEIKVPLLHIGIRMDMKNSILYLSFLYLFYCVCAPQFVRNWTLHFCELPKTIVGCRPRKTNRNIFHSPDGASRTDDHNHLGYCQPKKHLIFWQTNCLKQWRQNFR